jgi:hypothetical protein
MVQNSVGTNENFTRLFNKQISNKQISNKHEQQTVSQGSLKFLPSLKNSTNDTQSIIVTTGTINNTSKDAAVIYSTDNIEIGYAFTNHGVSEVNNFSSTLTLNGENLSTPIVHTYNYNSDGDGILSGHYYYFAYGFGHLAAGIYTVTVKLDSENVINEYDETDNTFTKTFVVMDYVTVPDNLRSIAVAQTSISLDWNDVEGASEYILQRLDSNGNIIETINTVHSQHVDTGLSVGTTYQYRIKTTGSDFSDIVTVTTKSDIDDNGTVTDSPMILSAAENNENVIIIWTNLGLDYRYLVYKGGQVIVNLENVTSYIDSVPDTVNTYVVYAYNDKLEKWSWANPVVVQTTAPKIEINKHKIINGQIQLIWNTNPNLTNYSVYQKGFKATEHLQTNTWTDPLPLTENQYQIYAYDTTTEQWTWSNIYYIELPQHQTVLKESELNILDEFFTQYNPFDMMEV